MISTFWIIIIVIAAIAVLAVLGATMKIFPGMGAASVNNSGVGRALTGFVTAGDCHCSADSSTNAGTCVESELDPYTSVASSSYTLYRLHLTPVTAISGAFSDTTLGISGKNTQSSGVNATQAVTSWNGSSSSPAKNVSSSITALVRHVNKISSTSVLAVVQVSNTYEFSYRGKLVETAGTSYPTYTTTRFLPTGAAGGGDDAIQAKDITLGNIVIGGQAFYLPDASDIEDYEPVPLFTTGWRSNYLCSDYYAISAQADAVTGGAISLPSEVELSADSTFSWHRNSRSAYATDMLVNTTTGTTTFTTAAAWPTSWSVSQSFGSSPVRFAAEGDSVLVYVRGGDTGWGLQVSHGPARPDGTSRSYGNTFYLGPKYAGSTYNTNASTHVYRADNYTICTAVYTLTSAGGYADGANVSRYDVPAERSEDKELLYTYEYANYAAALAAQAAAPATKVFAFRFSLPKL